MTKESIELLTHICRDGAFWKERDMTSELETVLDEIENLIPELKLSMPCQGFCVIGKSFSTCKECENYYNAIEEVFSIFVEDSVQTGAGGITEEGCLFGRCLRIDKAVFIEVDRTRAFALASRDWMWGGNRYGDFISFMNRNNGKHWDELKRPLNEWGC